MASQSFGRSRKQTCVHARVCLPCALISAVLFNELHGRSKLGSTAPPSRGSSLDMSRNSAQLSQSRESFAQVISPETPSHPIDISKDESPAKVQPCSGQTSKFGSAPPKASSGSTNTRSSWSSPVMTSGKSFSTWKSEPCYSFSDADLGLSDELPILEKAPLPPKPQALLVPLLKARKTEDRSRQVHCRRQMRVAAKRPPKIEENLEDK